MQMQMDFIFLVYAKLNTNEKLVIPVPNIEGYAGILQKKLNEQLGGEWILVDKVRPGEFLLFTDGMTYQGFDPRIIRYTDSIKVFEDFMRYLKEQKFIQKN